jgi:hypothetical protein
MSLHIDKLIFVIETQLVFREVRSEVLRGFVTLQRVELHEQNTLMSISYSLTLPWVLMHCLKLDKPPDYTDENAHVSPLIRENNSLKAHDDVSFLVYTLSLLLLITRDVYLLQLIEHD